MAAAETSRRATQTVKDLRLSYILLTSLFLLSLSHPRPGRHIFCGNAVGQLVVIHLPSRTVVVRADVHPGPITALDVLYLDPSLAAAEALAVMPVSPTVSSFAAAAADEGAAAFGLSGDVADTATAGSPRGLGANLAPAVLLASASKDTVCVYAVRFDKSVLSLLCTGDTPLKGGESAAGGGAGGVARLELSPDGRALALTAGGGALAVYRVPELPAEEWPGYVQLQEDVGGGRATGGVPEAAKEEPPAAVAGAEASAMPSGNAADTSMARLVWLQAPAAAMMFGLATRAADVGSGAEEVEAAPAAVAAAQGDEGTPAAPAAPDSNPAALDPTTASRGAPTTHFRLIRLPAVRPAEFVDEVPAPRYRADAVFARWPGCNRLAMFQLEGGRNVPARVDCVPNLRDGKDASEGGSGGGEGGANKDILGEVGDAQAPPPTSFAAGTNSLACDWTMPFPVSASATTDDGNLLALGMTDGSVLNPKP
jgi:hypothetical protein